MDKKKLKNWQPILIVSPYEIKIPEIPQTNTVRFYKVLHAFNAPRALRIIKEDSPAVIVINIFLEKYIRSIQESINLIEEARKKEFNSLIIATSTIPVNQPCQANMIGAGANVFLPADRLEKDIVKIIQNYEKLMLCEKEYLNRSPGLTEEIRAATFYLNQKYLEIYFERNPGIKEIKIDPWRINRANNNSDRTKECEPDSYCFKFFRHELVKN